MNAVADKVVRLTDAERALLDKHGHKVFHYEDGREVCKVTCPRCGGTGHYSRCEMYGTRCFQCNVASNGRHIGYVYDAATKTARRLKRREAAERRAARLEAKKAASEAAFLEALAGRTFVPLADVLAETRRLRELRAAEAQARRDAEVAAGNRWLLEVLARVPYSSEFVASMKAKLATEPLAGLSDRCLEVLRDIYAKTVTNGARRNSKSHTEAEDEFWGHLDSSRRPETPSAPKPFRRRYLHY